MKAAYFVHGKDIALLYDDGTLSNHFILSALCRGGTRVVRQPTFPEWQGAEAGTQRTYSIVVEGEVLDKSVTIGSFHERLSFNGGGPMFAHLQPLQGLPQKQLIYESTPYQVSQDGEAVGIYSYPVPPGPIWPSALKENPRIRQGQPRRSGPVGKPFYTDFPISWSYRFESALPLVGKPNVWI